MISLYQVVNSLCGLVYLELNKGEGTRDMSTPPDEEEIPEAFSIVNRYTEV